MSYSWPVRLHPGRTFKLLLAILYVFLISGAVIPPLLSQDGTQAIDLQDGLPSLQIALSITLALIAFEFIRTFWRRGVGVVLQEAWIPASFVFLALLSYIWSVDPSLTLRRGVAVTGMLLVAIFLLAHFGYRRSVMLITGVLAFVAILSLLTSLVLPSVGVHQIGSHLGRWKGVYLHKNLLGREMALGVGLFILAATHTQNRKTQILWTVFAVLAFILVIQAHSATGLVAAVAALLMALSLYWSRSRAKVAVVLVGLAVLVSFVLGLGIVFMPERIFDVLGRDLTFTGRSTLWHAVLDKIVDAPLVGYGYRAFWGSAGGVSISESLGWRVVHAHNALLDVVLSLGVLGFLSTLYLLLTPLVRWVFASPLNRVQFSQYYETGVVVVVTVLVISASDSVLLGPSNLFLLLLFLQFARIGRMRGNDCDTSNRDGFAATPIVGTRT